MPRSQDISAQTGFATRRSDWGWRLHLHDALPLSLRTRLLVHWRANLGMLRSVKIMAISSLISIAPTIVFAIVLYWTAPLKPNRIQSGHLAPTTILVLAAAALLAWLLVQHLFIIFAMNRWYAPFVRREIAALGMPMCPACGHRLASMLVGRCSECGSPVPAGES